ncbi:Ion transport protein-domain-containing protein [Dichotomocladium elegans]|nr:Ion transport protein-domain-containing protein [Dichotomocladium elegans]
MSQPGNRPEGGVSRLSSNNPYRDLEAQQPSPQPHDVELPTEFMSFTSRESVGRRNTTSTRFVSAAEDLDAIFEEQRQPLYSHTSRPESIASVTDHFAHYDATEEHEYSDTARLTANMQGGDNGTQSPTIPPPTRRRTASTIVAARRKQSLRKVATVIRNVSRRVVNNDNMIPLVESAEESIPMTATTSGNLQKGEDTADVAGSPESQEQKLPAKRSKGIVLAGKSLGLFGANSILRRTTASLLHWRWTESIVMLVIAAHGIVLFADGWGQIENPTPASQWGQNWHQYVLLVIFCFYTVFIVIQIVTFGFILSPTQRYPDDPLPPKAYLRHSWNRIDLLSVVCYWIDFGLTSAGQVIDGDTKRILVFKALSALILLRLLLVTNGNRVILHSLKKAGPLLVTVTTFVLFFFMILAIIGVQAFKGSFLRRCVWQDPSDPTHTEVLQQYCGGYMEGGEEKPYLLRDGTPGPWSKGFICQEGLVCQETENPFGGTISFDNIFASMLVVVIIAGDQSWTDRMYDMMDAEYFIVCLYFIVIVIVMNFWLINLFVAVINEMFAKVREDSNHSAFTTSKAKPVLADADEGWSIGQTVLRKAKKINLFASFMRLTHPFWVLLVAADLIVMGLKNNDMTIEQLATLDRAELGFTLAFLGEIIIRFCAEWPTWKKFFHPKTNRVDLLIAIVTCIIQIPPIHDNRVVYAWLTGFQIIRIYRIVLAIPRLRTLSFRVLGSVWGLINLVFFIVLATVLCAIMAFQLFEGLLNDSEDEMRFFSIYNSFAALYQLFSGEDWTSVLYSSMEASVSSKTAAITALFLVLWFLCSNFILVNMFIAVLMENFETAEEEKKQRQIQQYAQKKELVENDDPVVSRWNIYRYFRAKPKGVDVSNMPANLVLHARKAIVRDFMHDGSNSNEKTNDAAEFTPGTLQGTGERGKSGHASVRGFISHFLSRRQARSQSASRRTIYLEDRNPLDQFHTFYDTRKSGEHDPLPLRQILGPPKDNATGTNALTEAMLLDSEERRAQRQEFIAAHPTYDKSLYVFSQHNLIRRWCQMLVPPSRGERYFGTPPSLIGSWIVFIIICCSVVTTVVLTIYNSPVYQFENRDNQEHLMVFTHLDWAFTFIFSAEFIIKVIADGLLLTPNAYLLNGWNVLDLFVLITLYMSNFGHFASSTGLERAFRAFKALRALRLINLLKPAREMFTVILVKGLPYIFDATLFCLFLIIPFALYGQNIFQGLFYFCNDGSDDITSKFMCVYEAMQGTQEPMPDTTEIFAPRVWDNPYVYSFDSFWKGLSVLVELASGEGWIDVLVVSMGIVGKDLSPRRDASQLWGIFFMVYNLVGSVMVISLFLGVVLENFSRRNGTAYMTADQRRWLDLKKLLSRMRPAKRPKEVPTSPLRKWCFDRVVNKRGNFYKFMTAVIVLNILFLCTEFDQDDNIIGYQIARGYVFLVFISIYWLEIGIKLVALGWGSFRRNLWNLYDIIAVSGSTVTVIASLGDSSHQVVVEAQKLFMTALCFKLVQRSDSLNQLFTIIAASAYQIANVFAVWFIVLNTYAIMFMEIFALTKYGSSASTEHVNFRSYANTMISLVRFSTGEGWNTVMHDFSVESPNCVAAENYLDSDCGSETWAYFLFISFNIISMYIFTAIFVAVVADNFSYVYQIASNFSLVNRDEMRKFKKAWADVDVNRIGYIESSQYIGFWRKLDGVFRTRIYDSEFSYKTLAKDCALDERLVSPKEGPYAVRIDLRALRSRLNALDNADVNRRKRDLDHLFWEAAISESHKGVAFNDMLLMIARRKLVIPENAFLLDELLRNRKREEVVQTLIKIDRVKGMIETISLRKKFLRHLEQKRESRIAPPSIVVDNHMSRSFNMMSLYSAPPTPLTPTAVNSEYYVRLHDDSGSVGSGGGDLRSPRSPRSPTFPERSLQLEAHHHSQDNESLSGRIADESNERDVWHDMLQDELGK